MKKYILILIGIFIYTITQSQQVNGVSVRDSSVSSQPIRRDYKRIARPCLFCIGKDTPKNIDSINHTTCNGSREGYLSLENINNGNINYLWNTGDTGIRIRNLDAGTYTVTATDGYGCSDTASFTILALSNPILLPSISYQPYTTCDLRADSLVIVPYLPTPPIPLPLPYIPPIPRYTYTWTASNIDSLFPDTGTFIGGTSYRHVIPIHFADSLVGSTIVIRATDSNGCYDELRIWIEPCCVRSDARLLSNTTIRNYMNTESYYFGAYDSTSIEFDNKKIRINGTLIIDTNTIFKSSQLFMENNSKIAVKSGVTLTIMKTTILVACDTSMWQGIILEANANFADSEYCKVYDALTGVKCKKNNTFIIKQADFNRNWIDIEVGASFFTNNSILHSSHLYCHEDMMPSFGNTLPPTGGTLWYPHRNELSTIGMRINLNKDLTIGDPSLDPFNMNIFEDKNYGIYATASGIAVMNNQFNNMRVIPGYCDIFSGIYVLDSAGDAIYYEALNDLPNIGKQLIVKYCTFDKIKHSGISTTGAYTTGEIKHNRMSNVFCGILNNNIINSIAYKPLFMDTNYIEFDAIGIGCNNVRRMNIHILADTLIASDLVFTSCGGRARTGIRIAMPEIDAAGNSMIAIRDNLIMNGTNGIEIQSINTMPAGIIRNSIINNTIQTTLKDIGFTGIRFTNSHNFTIGWNTISGRSSVPADRSSLVLNKKGILLNSSSLNTINCNNFDYLFKGFEYIGRCNMSQRLFNNQFNHLGNHLFCSDTLGFIGNVNNAGIGSPRFHSNSMNFTAANYSIYNLGRSYRYSRQGFGAYNPWNPATYTIPFVPLGVLPATSLAPLNFCTTPPPPLLRLGYTETLVLDTVSYEEAIELIDGVPTEENYNPDNIGYEVLSKEQIYDMLINDSILRDIDSIAQFILQMQDEDIATYNDISEAIQAQNYAYAQALTNTLGNESYINQAYQQWFNLWSSIDYNSSLDQSIYNDSLLVDSLIANEYLPSYNYYKLDESALNGLMLLANLCPYRYGQAVYNARVLINTQNGFENMSWDDEQICYNAIGYKKDNSEPELFIESVTNPNIGIYPNPASTLLNYKISSIDKSKCEQISSLKIFNGTGVLIYSSSIQLNTREGTIDISKYSEGIYIINFKCMDGTNTIYKFVINH